MSLKEELNQLVEKSKKNIPDEISSVMKSNLKNLIESGISSNVIGVGEIFPNFILPDSLGNNISMKELLKEGPLVISFYRGGWCPYCNLELNALEKIIPDLKKLNAQLVAISPETPDNSTDTKNNNNLSFTVLSDIGNVLSTKLGLTFKLSEEIIEIYNDFGLDVEKHNGNNDYELPMAATFIVGIDRKIIFSDVNTDYKSRTEPEDLLKIIG